MCYREQPPLVVGEVMHHIRDKTEFYDMSQRMLLGNRLESWTSAECVRRYWAGELAEIVGVRRIQGGFVKGKSHLVCREEAFELASSDGNQCLVRFDSSAPHGHLTFQGEVAATERGLDLRYSYLQMHQQRLWESDQRGAVQYATGLRASALLQKYMDASSWEMLNEILSCQLGDGNSYGNEEINFVYPTVEFSCFDIPVGVLGCNTLFWEARTLC